MRAVSIHLKLPKIDGAGFYKFGDTSVANANRKCYILNDLASFPFNLIDPMTHEKINLGRA